VKRSPLPNSGLMISRGCGRHRPCRRRCMPLDQYCFDKRPVVQNASTTVYDAVRALEGNHIGAVIVHDGGEVVGIVTDRDLALRVVGAGLAPEHTTLHDVMTRNPVTLSIEASEAQAVMLMRAHHVRRIPILDGERVAGVVTLDDLLMSGAVNTENAGAIVESQLREPASLKPAGDLYPMRLPVAEGRVQRARSS
jgi:signal-transduction protein with cAMP-binding, CBS, and nucleotidyltransferase domain